MFHLGWSITEGYQKFGPGRSIYQCSWCPYFSPNKFDMKKHVLKHTGERPFACSTCGRRFARKDNLKKHELGTHHKVWTVGKWQTNNVVLQNWMLFIQKTENGAVFLGTKYKVFIFTMWIGNSVLDVNYSILVKLCFQSKGTCA